MVAGRIEVRSEVLSMKSFIEIVGEYESCHWRYRTLISLLLPQLGAKNKEIYAESIMTLAFYYPNISALGATAHRI